MASIVPSERLRRELHDLVAGVGEEDDPIEAIGRLGARLILQQALEEELSEFLGRERYERRGEPVSHRNGYERVAEETFDQPMGSKSTVSRICADTRERYRAWCGRRLDEHDLVYLFLDAVYLKLRPDDTPAEGVLVAWGVTLDGRKVLLGLQLGSRESYEDWLDFGRDLLARGARPPALVVADGAPGLWKAARELWPTALEQRCTVHYADFRVMPTCSREAWSGAVIAAAGSA